MLFLELFFFILTSSKKIKMCQRFLFSGSGGTVATIYQSNLVCSGGMHIAVHIDAVHTVHNGETNLLQILRLMFLTKKKI